MTRTVDVRGELTEALRLDLVGPRLDDPYADEVLRRPGGATTRTTCSTARRTPATTTTWTTATC